MDKTKPPKQVALSRRHVEMLQEYVDNDEREESPIWRTPPPPQVPTREKR